MNTHPVRVAITLKANPILFENLPTVCNILELMSDREFKNRRDVNEVLSLKFHILHYIVKDMKVKKFLECIFLLLVNFINQFFFNPEIIEIERKRRFYGRI